MTQPPFENGGTPIRLGDRYEIGELLGRGGMADVRKGRDLRLGRTVAIKQLRADLAIDPVFQERFRREAQSAAALNHPAIVAVYDTGEAPNAEGAMIPYIVMEYVEGRTLRDVLRDGRRILPERALEVVGEILSALDYSHRSGIVHRDIKPANVMLTPEGKVKVMDFGIARAIADASSAMTQTAAVIGTAQYLSPEQARGETVDARSDIYSTGCVLYELLTGRPPFVGDSPVSVAYQHVREESQPPSRLNADVSSSVDAIVAKALAKRTEDRYQSAADMRTDVERALAGHFVESPTLAATSIGGLPTQVVPATAAGSPGSQDDEDEESNRGKIVAASIVGLVILVALIAGLWYFLSGGEDVETAVVPDVVGKTAEAAERELTTNDFVVTVNTVEDDEVEAGIVVSQDPPGGDEAEVGSTITLDVSGGPADVSVPDVVGLDYDEAQSQLRELGLSVSRQNVDNDAPTGEVVDSNPSGGSAVAPGTKVTLSVSNGTSSVPNVVGQSESKAKSTLKKAGFKVRVTYRTTSSDPDGTVLDQNPGSGSKQTPGATITIFVAKAPDEPSPTDEPPAEDEE